MHIIRNTVVLENPSDSSHHKAEEVCVCMQHDLQYMSIYSMHPPSSILLHEARYGQSEPHRV